MADLFDMNMGGSGWHITSHLIAITALFIACFAIAGYITYRDNTIPAKAIKDGFDFSDEAITAASLTSLGTLTVNGNTTLGDSVTDTISTYGFAVTSEVQTITLAANTPNASQNVPAFTQPANTYISGLTIHSAGVLTTANTNAAQVLDYRVGTAAGQAQLCALTQILARNESFPAGQTLTVLKDGCPTASTIATGEIFNAGTGGFATASYTAAQRAVHVSFLPANAAMVHTASSLVTVTMHYTSSV